MGLELANLQDNFNEKKGTYNTAQETLNGYYTDITGYESNYQRVLEGGESNYKLVLASMGASLYEYGTSTDGELKNQVELWDAYVKSLEEKKLIKENR